MTLAPSKTANPGPTSLTEPPPRVVKRLWSRYSVREDGCWVSGYSTASHGYAQIGWQEDGNRFLWLAHRVAWFSAYGPIPEGMTVDHLCRTRPCVNPEHLRLLTNEDNARRNGWTRVKDYPLEWTCSRNHGVPRRKSNGQCPECHRENNREYRAREREGG